MKTLNLSSINKNEQFYKTFDLVTSKALVNRLNKCLDWNVNGKGSQEFARSLVGIASNLAALKWCTDDTSRSVYRMGAAYILQQMQQTEHYKLYAHLIKLPAWIYKPIKNVGEYSHGSNSTRLP
jgi:hypothetical protein